MEPATWVTATVVALAAFHLLLLGYLSNRRNATPVGGDGASDSGGNAFDDDDDAVRCRECGAANDPDYRYCRHCVTELPGATTLQRSGSTPIGGLG